MNIGDQIIKAAKENGASIAGIASMEELRKSPSHRIYTKMDDYTGIGTEKGPDALSSDQLFNWPDSAKSILVIGLSHPKEQPELDWFVNGGTKGNSRLIEIIKATRRQIEDELYVESDMLHYFVEKGGVFLKDAAVLAGLGCIGRNNMLVTPRFGPRIRLRALFLKKQIDPTGPITFDPCGDCKGYCRRVCPEKAMDRKPSYFEGIDAPAELPGRDGMYNRITCNDRMEKDIVESGNSSFKGTSPIRYCRKCEFICPVGKVTSGK